MDKRKRDQQKRGQGLSRLAVAAVFGLAAVGSVAQAESRRELLLVGNGQGGTVSFVDTQTFQNLGEVNVTPDIFWRLLENPFVLGGYGVTLWREGGQRVLDDLVVTREGELLIVSRGWLGDVAAFDLTDADTPMVWRHALPGLRADHMTISPDGSRVVVSDTLSNKAFVLDPYTGERIGEFKTGTFAHDNDYSHDGKYIYNASIGNVLAPYALNFLKGPRQLTIVDAETLEVVKTYRFDRGIRPAAFSESDALMYAQFSYERGFRTVDMATGKVIDRFDLPASEYGLENYARPDSYPNNSAHHGMAISGDGGKLCLAGTIDNYIAMVSLETRTTENIIHGVGKPYWAEASFDGRHCYVSNSDGNDLSVVDFETNQEIARVPVGSFPQRSRPVRLPGPVVATLFGE